MFFEIQIWTTLSRVLKVFHKRETILVLNASKVNGCNKLHVQKRRADTHRSSTGHAVDEVGTNAKKAGTRPALYDAGVNVFYFAPLASFPMSEKSGRYIDITMEPIVTPRKAMSTGSIIARRSAIAVSTSSS